MQLVHVVPVNKIVVGENRQRREFNPDAIKKLAHSISNTGLQNAIVVSDTESLQLVSGERRLRAVASLTVPFFYNGNTIQPGSIPVTIRHDLSPQALYEAELEENVQRIDLSWKERNDAIARLHELRSAQKAAVGEKQTFTATAQELKGDTPATTQDLTDVRHATLLRPFLNDPEVTKASSEREALSIVRRKLTQTFNLQLAKNFDVKKSSSPHTLIQGAVEVVLPTLDAGQFDCILVDPPYGIDAHKMAPMSGSTSAVKHEYEDTFEYAFPIWEHIFSEGARICKPQAHLYMFLDIRHWGVITALAKASGWDCGMYPIIWHKPGGGNLGDHTRWPRRSYETILFARRGDRRLTGVYLDVIVKAEVANAALHAAAKPVDLYVDLLRRSCVPGDRVIDPCAGSCPIFPAANRLRLVATAVEKSAVHYATGLQRLNEK